MRATPAQRVEMITISRVAVINPRIRNQRIFKDIVENIAEVGLKRPITVTRRMQADGPFYDLVCGQGRLEAYQILGQKDVPALVVSASEEDCLVASLVENCARRKHQALDLLLDIGGMKQRGYSAAEIARKTGLSNEYVHAVIRLLEHGEERLLRAVESGHIPFSVALDIAEANDQDVQHALQKAYDQKLLRGKRPIAAKRLIEMRRLQGKRLKRNSATHALHGPRKPLSSEALVRAYEEDAARKRSIIRRAEITGGRLMFIVEALRRLLADVQFRRILEQEGLQSLPEQLAKRVIHVR